MFNGTLLFEDQNWISEESAMIFFFQFSSNHILPICLPTTNIDLMGRKGVIAGWGKTSSDLSSGHTGTAILQTASVPIISMLRPKLIILNS